MQENTKEVIYAMIGLVGVLYGMYGGYLATGQQLAINTAGYFGIGGLLFGIGTGYQQARAGKLGSTDEVVNWLQEALNDD